MRQKLPTLIISFSTTTEAMAAEKFCTENALPGRLIPLPGEISAGCGLAWKAKPEDGETLLSAFENAEIKWSAKDIIVI